MGYPPNVVQTAPGVLMGAGPPDVPLLFRMPSAEEVRDLLECEGLPAYVGLSNNRGFTPKRLCLDSGATMLYVIEADAFVPSLFFGMSGFRLGDLRRISHGAV